MWRLFSYLVIYCKCLIWIKRIRKSIKWAISVLFPCWNLTVVRLKDSFQSFFASTNASLTVLGWFHPLSWLFFWSKHVNVHFMDQRKSYFLHVGRKFSILTERAHDGCWSDGVWALFPLLGPGLEVLEGVQRRVVGTQWIGHRWFAEGLLEGGLLQLHDEAIGLLTLRFPLLGCLSPKKGKTTFMRNPKHLEMICVFVRSSLSCKSAQW